MVIEAEISRHRYRLRREDVDSILRDKVAETLKQELMAIFIGYIPAWNSWMKKGHSHTSKDSSGIFHLISMLCIKRGTRMYDTVATVCRLQLRPQYIGYFIHIVC